MSQICILRTIAELMAGAFQAHIHPVQHSQFQALRIPPFWIPECLGLCPHALVSNTNDMILCYAKTIISLYTHPCTMQHRHSIRILLCSLRTDAEC